MTSRFVQVPGSVYYNDIGEAVLYQRQVPGGAYVNEVQLSVSSGTGATTVPANWTGQIAGSGSVTPASGPKTGTGAITVPANWTGQIAAAGDHGVQDNGGPVAILAYTTALGVSATGLAYHVRTGPGAVITGPVTISATGTSRTLAETGTGAISLSPAIVVGGGVVRRINISSGVGSIVLSPWTVGAGGSVATLGTITLAQADFIASRVWLRVLESSGLTAEQMMRVMARILAGNVTGGGTGNEKFRDLANTKDSIQSINDVNGNRNVTIVDPN